MRDAVQGRDPACAGTGTGCAVRLRHGRFPAQTEREQQDVWAQAGVPCLLQSAAPALTGLLWDQAAAVGTREREANAPAARALPAPPRWAVRAGRRGQCPAPAVLDGVWVVSGAGSASADPPASCRGGKERCTESPAVRVQMQRWPLLHKHG